MSSSWSHLCAFGAGVGVACGVCYLTQRPLTVLQIPKEEPGERKPVKPKNHEEAQRAGEWETSYRKRHKEFAGKISEPCVLDVSPANISAFETDYSIPHILTDLTNAGLPAHWVRLVWCVMVARGVAKAFTIRTELVNYKKVILHLLQAYSSCEISIRQLSAMFYCARNEGTKEDHIRHVTLDKTLMKINGCLAILRCVRTWTKAITSVSRMPDHLPVMTFSGISSTLDTATTSTPTPITTVVAATSMTSSQKPLFRAGDNCIFVMPADMHTALDLVMFRRLVADHGDIMRSKIHTEGWPPPSCAQGLQGTGGHRHTCKECKLEYGKAWVRDNLCWRCEDSLREQGRCPWEQGSPAYLCPHARLCLACEQHDCVECGFARGDGTAVEGLVYALRPQLLVLDFDQTVCDTKSGTAPKVGKNGINPSLLRVINGNARSGCLPSVFATKKDEVSIKSSSSSTPNLLSHVSLPASCSASPPWSSTLPVVKTKNVQKAKLTPEEKAKKNEILRELYANKSRRANATQVEQQHKPQQVQQHKAEESQVPVVSAVHIITRQNAAHAQAISQFLAAHGVGCTIVPKPLSSQTREPPSTREAERDSIQTEESKAAAMTNAKENAEHNGVSISASSSSSSSSSWSSSSFPPRTQHVYLHCLGRSRTTKATTIHRLRGLCVLPSCVLFVDDTASELLGCQVSPGMFRLLFSDSNFVA